MVAMLQHCLTTVIIVWVMCICRVESANATETPAETSEARQYGYREHWPPPPSNLKKHRECVRGDEANPMVDCHGAKFNRSMGFFQPCSRHAHCYHAREPSDWCLINNDFMWTNWGCHCDKKLGSCVIERFSRWDREMQWAYCVPKSEFYCATRYYNVKATLHSHDNRQHH